MSLPQRVVLVRHALCFLCWALWGGFRVSYVLLKKI